MSNDRVIETLWHMRGRQVANRQNAVNGRNLADLRQSQADIEMIDRAIADEVKIQKEWVASEAERLDRLNPKKDDGGWLSDEPRDPMLL